MPLTVIVIPCYNEAERLDDRAFRDAAASQPETRFIFVDDGSTDATRSRLEALAASDPGRLEVLALPRNVGKGEAVRQGFLRAFERGEELVGFWDADLATPLEDIPSFVDLMERRPQLLMVFGARVNLLGRSVQRKLLRHYVGRVFATAAAAALQLPIYDTQCGAKLFRATEEIQELFAEPFRSRWIFDVEIIARLIAARRGTELGPVREVIYEHPLMTWYDVKGSKIRLRDFVVVGLDLLRIYLRYLRH
ncbi:MAG: glycosyltransferase [Planctomycetota bacterium]|jgi:glycosyltransferase involved in cell wall biosynthesis